MTDGIQLRNVKLFSFRDTRKYDAIIKRDGMRRVFYDLNAINNVEYLFSHQYSLLRIFHCSRNSIRGICDTKINDEPTRALTILNTNTTFVKIGRKLKITRRKINVKVKRRYRILIYYVVHCFASLMHIHANRRTFVLSVKFYSPFVGKHRCVPCNVFLFYSPDNSNNKFRQYF